MAILLAVAAIQANAAETLLHDDAGRAVAVPARIERVFPAGPPAAIDLFVVAPDKLLGWTRGTHPADAAFVAQRYADLPVLGRLTGRGNTANLEDLMRVKPDLVLDVGNVSATAASLADRVQQQTGLPYVVIGGTLAQTPALLRRLGGVLGEDARADALARYVQDMLADIGGRIGTVPQDRRPRVYLARGPRGLETAKAGSLNGEALDLVGARNVAAVALDAGNLMDVSMEQVLLWRPDAIIAYDPGFAAAVGADPLWQSVPAVAARRVFVAPTLPFAWIDEPPALNRVIGVRWLAKLLYPELFPGDLRPEVRRFYELFYQRAPTDAQLDALLGGTGAPR